MLSKYMKPQRAFTTILYPINLFLKNVKTEEAEQRRAQCEEFESQIQPISIMTRDAGILIQPEDKFLLEEEYGPKKETNKRRISTKIKELNYLGFVCFNEKYFL